MVLLRVLAVFLLCGSALAQDRYFDAGGVRIRYVDQRQRAAGGAGARVHRHHRAQLDQHRRPAGSGARPPRARARPARPWPQRQAARAARLRRDRARRDPVARTISRSRKPHVVGYSLGGIIVAKLLTTAPERFLSAVLGGAAYRRARGESADDAPRPRRARSNAASTGH
jgi:alpha-beta hydrolase superfamily lysophospholipase